ncbi:class I SAM-dependent methyltransferase [Amycolatopsis alkalitolerans]|uniref:S-adenosyl-L-methionine-dependent methyltransferase n=1 Tax=Amycolatopsis alkalitolerans TaxID=2547244 RepID=A0A5C4M9S7_9PSEU|nr:SAM-dependent methyltransferase [Amycolatopsis alkalitolerans]TNC29684.1 class I SAM-dependent methyltransferase [Amycolatopsis alkalitolerans]
MLSETAFTAAAARAAHLIVDAEPRLFADVHAMTLLGDRAEELVRYHRSHGDHPILRSARIQTAVRSRFTEDALAASGARQYVLLGAGLDSFAHRDTLGVRVFEVDHPEMQQWKRDRLPGAASYVPFDFENGDLARALAGAGFDPGEPAFVGWLGVTMYLSRESIARTLAVVGNFAPGSRLSADYLVPAELRDAAAQAYADGVSAVAADRGEPWRSCFSPEQISVLLKENGLQAVADMSQREAVARELWQRADGLTPGTLSRLVLAEVTPAPR